MTLNDRMRTHKLTHARQHHNARVADPAGTRRIPHSAQPVRTRRTPPSEQPDTIRSLPLTVTTAATRVTNIRLVEIHATPTTRNVHEVAARILNPPPHTSVFHCLLLLCGSVYLQKSISLLYHTKFTFNIFGYRTALPTFIFFIVGVSHILAYKFSPYHFILFQKFTLPVCVNACFPAGFPSLERSPSSVKWAPGHNTGVPIHDSLVIIIISGIIYQLYAIMSIFVVNNLIC